MSQDYISLEEIMRIIHTVTSIPDDLNYYEPDVENGLIEIGEATVIFCYLKYFLDYFDNVLENIADEMESLKNESLEFIAKSDELLSVEMQMGLLWDYTLILIEERFHFDVKEIVNLSLIHI